MSLAGNMKKAEALVAEMEKGIKMNSMFAMFDTNKDQLALPNDEVMSKNSLHVKPNCPQTLKHHVNQELISRIYVLPAPSPF